MCILSRYGSKKKRESLQEKITDIIAKALNNSDIHIQKKSSEIIDAATPKHKHILRKKVSIKITEALLSNNLEIQRVALNMIRFAENNDKDQLFNLALTKGLGQELIKPPLYKNKPINNKSFSRQAFEKTGSEITIIGGSLKDKTIIRHIEPKPFLSWQKAYESHAAWKATGFNYVPIEPIQSYQLTNKGVMDVYCSILGLSLSDWEGKTNLFKQELKARRDKILAVLSDLDVKHGHAHDSNFCLRFFRDPKGEIDFTRVPRIYLIDFDQAIS